MARNVVRAGTFIATVAALATATPAFADSGSYVISVASINAAGKAAGGSFRPFVDGDGGEVVFMSNSPKLHVPKGQEQSFVHNTVTGTTTMVSVATDGTMANGTSNHPQVSLDGSCVVFQSQATNLDSRFRTRGANHIYVHYLTGPQAGVTALVDATPAGRIADRVSAKPTVSGDCRYVAFETASDNLVDNPAHKNAVVRKDLSTGAVVPVSIAPDNTMGAGFRPSIDADGQRIAFYGAGRLTSYLTGGKNQVYLRDFTGSTPTTVLVSIAASGARAGDGASMHPSISPDGTFVGYDSHAKNLISGFAGTNANVFLYDIAGHTTELISHSTAGALQAGNDESLRPAVSSDGAYVEYYSKASDLVSGDTNGVADGFRWTRATDTSQRTSVSSSGAQGTNGRTIHIGISGDGQTVAMESTLQGLVPGVTGSQIYVGQFGQ